MLRVATLAAVLALSAGLAACNEKPADSAALADGPFSSPQKPGRYLGVGIYTPGQAWGQLVQAQQAPQAGDARLRDDQAIIVVMDSRTGEVRSCGDLTGYCIGMNPWGSPLVESRRTPVTIGAKADAKADAKNEALPMADAAPAAPGR